MKKYSIALYPGDGIGMDVVREVVKALDAVQEVFGFRCEMTEFDWGHRYWSKTGKVVPDGYLKTLMAFDAIFLGALGDPEHLPDLITVKPLLEMRQGFDQYACLRPATLLPGVVTPLANTKAGDIDILVVRENTEGEYINAGGVFKSDRPEETCFQVAVHTRKGVERILRFGFELARKRRNRLTMATKSNALGYGMTLWDRVLEGLKGEYPDVAADKSHIDALSMNFVLRPETYDVVVASNLFGDILSDLAGAIVGSLGLAPSANINPEKVTPSLFEPVHGSAPDIAGKGIANPIAAIRSAAMMMDFLGENEAARIMDKAVFENLKHGKIRTPDIGGMAKTSEVGDDIVARIRA